MFSLWRTIESGGISRQDSLSKSAEENRFRLSYTPAIRLGAAMRRPNRYELEAVFLAFLIGVPVAYWMVRTVLAFVGLG